MFCTVDNFQPWRGVEEEKKFFGHKEQEVRRVEILAAKNARDAKAGRPDLARGGNFSFCKT